MSNTRPPAVPLIVNDPYLSVWSMADCLTDDDTRHWTGVPHPLCGLIRIDGQARRFLGGELRFVDADIPAMPQVDLDVLPTRTIARFEDASIALTLTFTTPALPHDLDLLSRPLTIIDIEVRATDGKSHQVEFYLDVSARLVVDNPAQKVVWGRHRLDGSDLLWLGSQEQALLAKAGDDLRIDWGYLYSASVQNATGVLSDTVSARSAFADAGTLPGRDDTDMPRPVGNRPPNPCLAWTFTADTVAESAVSWQVLLAYDDGFSVEYMHRKLRPYWRRDGCTIAELIASTIAELDMIQATCAAYDTEVMADLRTAGGDAYAQLAALAFRQCLGAHKLVIDFDGRPLYFSKENFSNGCMGTVDVSYPSSPFFLLFNPDLLEAMLRPILDYAESPRWPFPFAPHDIGRYPLANGQVYGGGEVSEHRQMPVEECGNMLIMVAALCQARGDIGFAKRYWRTLSDWADYLLDKGLDPENQLCTDDFAGHLAHNVNLSAKALIAIAAFAELRQKHEMSEKVQESHEIGRQMAEKWSLMADDGDHTRLTFDRPDSWSQKYNLVWDQLLGLELFPAAVREREIAYYKTQLGRFGLPLDNRSAYTKLDWCVWSACLAKDPADFNTFIAPLVDWLNESPSRVPLTDWFYTDSGLQVHNMQARSVVGGVYIKLLFDDAIREKWLVKWQAHRAV